MRHVLLFIALALPAAHAQDIDLTRRELRVPPEAQKKIGAKIWENECDGTESGLVDWNEGEAFASLGIGHFIWYPTPEKGPYEESFPGLIAFLSSRGAEVPGWVKPGTLCPWPDRRTFFAAAEKGDQKIKDLRKMLKNTVPLQGEFLALRSARALGLMLEQATSPQDYDSIRSNFCALATTDAGLYCLLDYTNFKGEGTSPTERYNNQGWGLAQVLAGMTEPTTTAFSESAAKVLARRVANAPKEKQAKEKEWLGGWTNRCATYKKPL